MIKMWRSVRTRVPNVALGVIIGLMVGGGAYAIAATTTSDDGGVHGGTNPRFHEAGACNLANIGQLPGNWTHGDYVNAVKKTDPSKVQEAARSQCGKPSKAGKGQNNGQKGNGKNDEEQSSSVKPKASPKPSTPAKNPSSSPSPTGSASPVVPLETPTPSASPSSSPSV
jgi:hypothetical protein